MTYHLVATRTVPTTGHGMRRYRAERTPVPAIVVSDDDRQVVYDHALNQLGGRSWEPMPIEMTVAFPVFKTPDWTYWIVEQR